MHWWHFNFVTNNFTSNYEMSSFIIQVDFARIDLNWLGGDCRERGGGGGGGGGGGRGGGGDACCNDVSVTASVSWTNDDEQQLVSLSLAPWSLSISCCCWWIFCSFSLWFNSLNMASWFLETEFSGLKWGKSYSPWFTVRLSPSPTCSPNKLSWNGKKKHKMCLN